MTDLERELLDRVIALSVQLAEKQDYINRNEYAWHDCEEENTRLRKELEAVKWQAKELCKVIDELRAELRSRNTFSVVNRSYAKPIEFTDG